MPASPCAHCGKPLTHPINWREKKPKACGECGRPFPGDAAEEIETWWWGDDVLCPKCGQINYIDMEPSDA